MKHFGILQDPVTLSTKNGKGVCSGHARDLSETAGPRSNVTHRRVITLS